MKIDGGNGGKRIPTVDRSKKSAAKSGSGSVVNKSDGESDRVEIDAHSSALDVIRQMVSDVPDIRMDEVERVMKKLKDGKYPFDYEKVADGFIREALMSELSKRMSTKRGA